MDLKIYWKSVGYPMDFYSLWFPSLAWLEAAYFSGSGQARLETSRFKELCKMYITVLYWYYVSTEFESTFNVCWNGLGAAGLSCTELSISEFPSLREGCRQGGNSMTMCEWDVREPEEHPGQCCVHLYAFLSYRRLSPHKIKFPGGWGWHRRKWKRACGKQNPKVKMASKWNM